MTTEYERWYTKMMSDPYLHEQYLKRKRIRQHEAYKRRKLFATNEK